MDKYLCKFRFRFKCHSIILVFHRAIHVKRISRTCLLLWGGYYIYTFSMFSLFALFDVALCIASKVVHVSGCSFLIVPSGFSASQMFIFNLTTKYQYILIVFQFQTKTVLKSSDCLACIYFVCSLT